MKSVVIVGKPNVGKSQLFNRLSGERHSVVFDEPGITRDRVSLEVEWLGRRFLLTDTGGYSDEGINFQKEINKQVEIAINESDLILFLISSKDGINGDDFYLSKLLKKKQAKNVLVVANKCDFENKEILEENKLGFGNAIFISAEHGINTGILLNLIIEKLGIIDSEEENRQKTKLAIIGKPNVGKSSLINALLQEERIITSKIAGTTIDAIDLNFRGFGKDWIVIDTPGIRRHASIKDSEKDKYSLLRAKKAIARSNLLLFVVDYETLLTELDERIGGFIYDANIPVIMVVNKWDLAPENNNLYREKAEKEIRNRFRFLSWIPIVFVSAKNKYKLENIFKTIEKIQKEINKEVDEVVLNNFLSKVSALFSVPTVKGQKIKLYSIRKVKGQVPTFLILCNDPNLLHFSYSRLIENQIRNCFDYKIVPITVIFKKK